ncbi:hypothetical protein TUM12137_51860 (plasmid) [Klebsiella pneumoniae]|nr:hypothetical protein TUM12137_51860 [Klebsiella pneumoniae]BCY97336.1 hypothetical protein TUM12138_51870 [Klebsiella pneumoniae]
MDRPHHRVMYDTIKSNEKGLYIPYFKNTKRANKELIYRHQKHSLITAELILFSVYNDRKVFLG